MLPTAIPDDAFWRTLQTRRSIRRYTDQSMPLTRKPQDEVVLWR